jgi:phage terminase small subunit
MTPKRQRFVEEYLVDLNATQAAIRARYSPKRADAIGHDLLSFTEVKNAIDEALEERRKKNEVTAERVIQELARIAFVDLRKVSSWGPNGVTLLPSEGLTDDEAAIVAEVSETTSETSGSIKFKRFDKLKALELLGKHLGMFVERTENKTEISGRATVAFDPYEGLTTEELREIIRHAGTNGE